MSEPETTVDLLLSRHDTRYIDPIHDKAARAIAGVLAESGVLLPGPALNCAQACLTKLAVSGLSVIEGKMELWKQ